MADATYDAVIIGAGHNGMALATYLAKSGWDVAVFEARGEEGGGLATEEVTRPGFLHNLHANYHTLVGVCPVYDDLNLYDHGVEYVRPPVQMGAVFGDDTALTIHTDIDKTCASLARFSQKDADTFRRLYEETKGYLDLLIRTLMFSPPIPLLDITKALSVWRVQDKSGFLSVHLREMSVNDFLNRHFENDRVKAMLAFHSAVGGYCTDRKGLAVSFPLLVGKIDNWHVSVGGSHNLAHALWEACAHSGGRVFLQHEVEEIIVENGRASGVRLNDGSVVSARNLVASSIHIEQTFLNLVRNGLPTDFAEKVQNYTHMDWSFFTVHMALQEAPHYRAAEFDPDIDQAWVLNIGYESLEDLNDHWRRIRRGQIPEPRLNCAVNSLYDAMDAPDGCYTGLIRHFAPYELATGGAEAWDEFKDGFARRCIDKWAQHASNLSAAIIDWTPHTPLDISRRITNMVRGDWMGGIIAPDNLLTERPFPELSQYRTPFSGLYMCGATQHPHGFITFAPAYNALQIIAEDFGLERWWR